MNQKIDNLAAMDQAMAIVVETSTKQALSKERQRKINKLKSRVKHLFGF